MRRNLLALNICRSNLISIKYLLMYPILIFALNLFMYMYYMLVNLKFNADDFCCSVLEVVY